MPCPDVQMFRCSDVPPEYQSRYRRSYIRGRSLYAERTIDPFFEFPPESFYIRKILRSLYSETGLYPDVAWSLNPRYYASLFKTKIYYDAYPGSQGEIDDIVARLHLRRVIFDP
jgi:hypothetical protein